jgi:hypothetical protein
MGIGLSSGTYPMLALSGEQGSAKSTFSTILKALLDPNVAPFAPCHADRDLFIAATNGHVLGLRQRVRLASNRLWQKATKS